MSSKEAMDSGGSSRRRGSAPKAGSVWESRMKIDQVKGGIKVFNATHEIPQENATQIPEIQMDKKVPKQSPTGKRKTWKSEGLEGSPVKIAGLRSELSKNLDEGSKELSVSSDGIKKTRSGLTNLKSSVSLKTVEESGNLDEEIKTDSDDKKVGAESRSDGEFDVCQEKEITSNVVQIKNPSLDESDWDDDDSDEVENKRLDIKEIRVEDHKPMKTTNLARFHPTPAKINSCSGNFNGSPRTNSKLQSFVDLVMWRDVSKSAFVFGIGTFAIISSSYTSDLNISFISVVSYLGLAYLAAIFLFRSLISRGSKDIDNANEAFVVGEDEAIWVVKLFLPYVNEFLVKLRALFSGDPVTTMKLAVLLFILARCGSSITLWKMAKLGFIGVFTVPKICSTYSSQLTAYGTFWIRRFGDAWNSCSHKKAMGFATFTLIWNLSSVVARIWAVFMLFVAFKYYQQSLVKDEWAKETSTSSENSSSPRQSIGGQQPGRRFIPTETRKEKKVY